MARDFAYPADGVLRQHFVQGDFLDGQWVPLPHPAPDAAELTIATVFNMPGWATALLALRNLLVAPFGLKTGGPNALPLPTRDQINTQSYSGIFAVHSATPDEVILGTDDRHLDFRISILRSEPDDLVAISTWVRPHNRLGRIYLALVYPFHRLIVARCLQGAGRLGVTR